jgi:hypothetical protein
LTIWTVLQHHGHKYQHDVGVLAAVPAVEIMDWPRLVTDQSIACRSYDLSPDQSFGKHADDADQLDCKEEGEKAWVQIKGYTAVVHRDKYWSRVHCSFKGMLAFGCD